MSIYKRGDVYWYKFQFNGTLVRESTRQGNDKVARQMESAHRTSLAKGEVGIRDKKTVPTLKEFCDRRFEPWLGRRSSALASTTGFGFGLGSGGLEAMNRWRTRNLMRSLTRSWRDSLRMNKRGYRIAASPNTMRSAASP